MELIICCWIELISGMPIFGCVISYLYADDRKKNTPSVPLKMKRFLFELSYYTPFVLKK